MATSLSALTFASPETIKEDLEEIEPIRESGVTYGPFKRCCYRDVTGSACLPMGC